jgi:ApaG protein
MSTTISQGVKISVTTIFRRDLSNADASEFFYNYVIEIENQNPFDVQLLNRHWKIVDSLRPTRLVEGPGVIGEQPKLTPGEVFSYSSGCDLESEIGFMIGKYEFAQFDALGKVSGTFFVDVPKFKLEFPPKLN